MKFTKVLKRLKTNKKVASLGFNRKELRSIAQQICDNSDLGDDATEEEENTYIDESITDTLPYLQLGQQYANRLANENGSNASRKPKHNDDDDDDDDDDEDVDDDDEDHNRQPRQKSKKPKSNDGSNDGEPSWFKKYRESMDARFEKIESSRTVDTRRSQVEKILKDAKLLDKSFGKKTLRDFGRMKFESDDDFQDFLDDIADDVEDISGDGNGEECKDDISPSPTPKDITPPKGGKKGKKNDVASDEDVDALAGMF